MHIERDRLFKEAYKSFSRRCQKIFEFFKTVPIKKYGRIISINNIPNKAFADITNYYSICGRIVVVLYQIRT